MRTNFAVGCPPVLATVCFGAMVSVAMGLVGCVKRSCPVMSPGEFQGAVETLRHPEQPIRSLRAEAKVSQRGGNGRGRGTVWMLVQSPDRLRVDVMSSFGPVATLASDGERLVLIDLRKRQAWQGKPCAANVSQLLGVALEAEVVVRLLTGQTPVLAGEAQRRCSTSGNPVACLRSADGVRQELEFSATKPPRLRRVQWYGRHGRPLWRTDFDDYRAVRGATALPHRMRLQDAVHGSELELRFEKMHPNATVPLEAFQLVPPPGMPLRELSCDR